eukprot:3780191-Prymnesium_polylepis.1
MAWVDELWKGRVEDSSHTNEFIDSLKAAGLCPNSRADEHVGCGYPSVGVFDGVVNEEWFGIFAIQKVCKDADQIRPRDTWFNLKRLWRMGGCVQHRGNLSSGPQTSYSEDEYPACGEAIKVLREVYEAEHFSNRSFVTTECDYQNAAYLQTVGGGGD